MTPWAVYVAISLIAVAVFAVARTVLEAARTYNSDDTDDLGDDDG